MNDIDRVRALLTATADQMPGGPVVVPTELPARAQPSFASGLAWRRPWVVGAVAALVVAAVAVPTWLVGQQTPPRQPVVPLPGYTVAPATGDPSRATAAALAGGRWSELPPAPIEGRSSAVTVWTGHEMVVWGSESATGEALADGAAFDPAAGRWRRLAPSPLAGRLNASAVWTGEALFIWAGLAMVDGDPRVLSDGALYDPVTDTWRVIAAGPLGARTRAAAFWTGGQVLVVGGEPAVRTDTLMGFLDAAVYDLGSDRWSQLPAIDVDPRQPVQFVRAAATPVGLYLWSFWSLTETSRDANGEVSVTNGSVMSYRYDPAAGRWTTVGAEQPMDLGSPVWTGAELVFPASPSFRPGRSGPMPVNLAGWRLVPTADASGGQWTRIKHGPVDDLRTTSVWTGAALLSADSQTTIVPAEGSPTYPGAAAVWDPQTGEWTRLPDAPLASAGEPNMVWTGGQLLIWGLMQLSRDPSGTVTAGLSFGSP